MNRLHSTLEPSDCDLVAQVRDGSMEAFGTLVERHHPRVMQVLLRRCEDYDTAEELADRAVLIAFEHIGQLRDGSQPGKWFVGIAINIWKMRARRRSRLVSLDNLDEQLPLPSVLADRPDEIELYPEHELLLQALGQLKDSEWQALTLKFEGYANTEIADLLHITPSPAQSRTYRALKRVRDCYRVLNEKQSLATSNR